MGLLVLQTILKMLIGEEPCFSICSTSELYPHIKFKDNTYVLHDVSAIILLYLKNCVGIQKFQNISQAKVKKSS